MAFAVSGVAVIGILFGVYAGGITASIGPRRAILAALSLSALAGAGQAAVAAISGPDGAARGRGGRAPRAGGGDPDADGGAFGAEGPGAGDGPLGDLLRRGFRAGRCAWWARGLRLSTASTRGLRR